MNKNNLLLLNFILSILVASQSCQATDPHGKRSAEDPLMNPLEKRLRQDQAVDSLEKKPFIDLVELANEGDENAQKIIARRVKEGLIPKMSYQVFKLDAWLDIRNKALNDDDFMWLLIKTGKIHEYPEGFKDRLKQRADSSEESGDKKIAQSMWGYFCFFHKDDDIKFLAEPYLEAAKGTETIEAQIALYTYSMFLIQQKEFKESVELLQQCAESGYRPAQVEYYTYLKPTGIHLVQEWKDRLLQAKEPEVLFDQAKETKDLSVLLEAAYYGSLPAFIRHYYELPCSQERLKGLESAKKLGLERAFPEVNLAIGYHYHYGFNTSIDLEKAEVCYLEAAKTNLGARQKLMYLYIDQKRSKEVVKWGLTTLTVLKPMKLDEKRTRGFKALTLQELSLKKHAVSKEQIQQNNDYKSLQKLIDDYYAIHFPRAQACGSDQHWGQAGTKVPALANFYQATFAHLDKIKKCLDYFEKPGFAILKEDFANTKALEDGTSSYITVQQVCIHDFVSIGEEKSQAVQECLEELNGLRKSFNQIYDMDAKLQTNYLTAAEDCRLKHNLLYSKYNKDQPIPDEIKARLKTFEEDIEQYNELIDTLKPYIESANLIYNIRQDIDNLFVRGAARRYDILVEEFPFLVAE